MGRTPDRVPGPRFEEEINFEDRGPGGDNTGDPSTEGAVRRVTKVLRYFVDSAITQIARWKNVPAGFDDVDLAGITDGQGLAYNDTTKQFEPQTFAGGGITESEHRDLDQLVHDIQEDSFEEIIRSGFQVTDVIIWTDSGKTTKIREENITYTGLQATQITRTQYDAAGVAVEIVVEDVTYTGFLATSITRTRTL